MPVGIVMRRCRIDNPWQDVAWRAEEAVAGVPSEPRWRVLRELGMEAEYLAGALPLTLHRGETAGYLHNLSQRKPVIYVVLRQEEGQDGPPLRPFHVTVCPTEAQDYQDGDDLVETVPMPRVVIDWLRDYIHRFHVDRPFKKRRRDSIGEADPDATRPRDAKGGQESG